MPKHRRGRFDHGPTKGGSEESAVYDDLYKETRDVREYLFGPAPADIWETLEHRWDPTYFCMYHTDLRRIANYAIAMSKIAIENEI